MPKRIQWRSGRKPPNTKVVTRSSRWANPFIVKPKLEPGSKIYRRRRTHVVVPTREEAIRRFAEEWMTPERRRQARRELRGKDLGCHCEPGAPCHADVLLAIANSDP